MIREDSNSKDEEVEKGESSADNDGFSHSDDPGILGTETKMAERRKAGSESLEMEDLAGKSESEKVKVGSESLEMEDLAGKRIFVHSNSTVSCESGFWELEKETIKRI